ncbi:MAG: hypothetical protein ABW135_11220 [Thermoleophilaceae bacterium]
MSTRTKKTPVKAPDGVTPPTAAGGRQGFLSDVIVELGFATRETVEQAVRAARSPGTTVARVLVEMAAISEGQLAQAIAERYGIDYIDLDGFAVDPAAVNLIKPTAAKRYQAVPVGFLGKGLLVAMADPADALGVNDIAVMTKLDVRPAVAARPALNALLEALPLDEGYYDEDEAVPANGDAELEAESVSEEETEAPAAPASSAFFWQDGDDDPIPEGLGESSQDEQADPSQLRDDLTALKAQLAGAEARLTGKGKSKDPDVSGVDPHVTELHAKLAEAEVELAEARVRVREAKEVSAELETLREALAAAEEGLDQASERARQGDQVSAEAEELRGRVAELEKELAAARTLGKDAERLRERVDSIKVERDEAHELARDAETELRRIRADVEVRSGEIETLRAKLTDAETELVRVRAEVDTRGSELESMRTRAESAEAEAESAIKRADASEREVEDAHREVEEAHREVAEGQRLGEELEASEVRTEQARAALTALREESEREREQWAVTERDVRETLAEEETRRAELEGRLSEVESSAFAAERAFEELRVAQGRMRGALRALADPDANADAPEETDSDQQA